MDSYWARKAKAAKEIGYDFHGVDVPKNKNGLYSLRYSEFVVPLVKAVQELSVQSDDKQKQIEELQLQNQELKARLNRIEQMLNLPATVSVKSVRLDQNIPNPFNRTTTIHYTLPPQYASVKIMITDKSGNVLKELNVIGSGKGSVQIDASTLASGTYQYSLIVDGK